MDIHVSYFLMSIFAPNRINYVVMIECADARLLLLVCEL